MTPAARPRFHRLPPPTDADIAQLLRRLHRRVRRLLIRRGRGSDEDAGRDPFAAQEPLFASAVAASLQSRVGLGPRAGQPVRRLRSAAAATATGRRSARLEGFSLHADVAVPARRRDQLEKLCRYVVRPPLALERLTESTGGPLLYQFRRPWRDGSTALLLDPVEWLERLAALVPPPRRPLLAYHGLLAPHEHDEGCAQPTPVAANGRLSSVRHYRARLRLRVRCLDASGLAREHHRSNRGREPSASRDPIRRGTRSGIGIENDLPAALPRTDVKANVKADPSSIHPADPDRKPRNKPTSVEDGRGVTSRQD